MRYSVVLRGTAALVAVVMATVLIPMEASAGEEAVAAVEGTVTSSEGGPAAGACVGVLHDGSYVVVAISDADGSYRLEPAPVGTFDLQAYDCVNDEAVWSASSTQQVTVAQGDVLTGVDFSVDPTGADPGNTGPPGIDSPEGEAPDEPDPEPQPDPVDPGDTPTFVDIAGSVFADDIRWLAAAGVTKGCNPPHNDRFCPNAAVTRGQMSAFLVRALGLGPGGDGDRFDDDDDSIFQADIQALASSGITKGCNPPANTRFCPDEVVSRAQMASFLTRALGLTDEDPDQDRFGDDDGSIFETDIEALASAGVTRGCNPPENDRFCPSEAVTRAQMAAFIRRALPPVTLAESTRPSELDQQGVVVLIPVTNPAVAHRFRSVLSCDRLLNGRMFTLSLTPEYTSVANVRAGWGNDSGWQAVRFRLFRWENGQWVQKASSAYHAASATDTGGAPRTWFRASQGGWLPVGRGPIAIDFSSYTTAPGYYAMASDYNWAVNGASWGSTNSVWTGATGSAFYSNTICLNPYS